MSKMDHPQAYHHKFVDGASPWSQNLIVVAWAIYSPDLTPFHHNGLCIETTTNNQDEYDVIIGLLDYASHLSINHLHVYHYSQLVVSQLNKAFKVHDPLLFLKYLHAKKLDRHFDWHVSHS